jgi:hypothetical protein
MYECYGKRELLLSLNAWLMYHSKPRFATAALLAEEGIEGQKPDQYEEGDDDLSHEHSVPLLWSGGGAVVYYSRNKDTICLAAPIHHKDPLSSSVPKRRSY